jgi:ribosomal protein uS13
MARIAGVDLPKSKRMEVALTYIYGIGRSSSREILTKAGVSFDLKSDDLTDDDTAKIRQVIEQDYKVEGDLRCHGQHQAAPRHGIVSRPAPPQEFAGARPAYAHERAHPQRTAQDGRR